METSAAETILQGIEAKEHGRYAEAVRLFKSALASDHAADTQYSASFLIVFALTDSLKDVRGEEELPRKVRALDFAEIRKYGSLASKTHGSASSQVKAHLDIENLRKRQSFVEMLESIYAKPARVETGSNAGGVCGCLVLIAIGIGVIWFAAYVVRNANIPVQERASPDQRTTKARVTAPNLNMRSGPGSTKPVVATLPKDTQVMLLGERQDIDGTVWVRVRANNRDGWVSAKHLGAVQ